MRLDVKLAPHDLTACFRCGALKTLAELQKVQLPHGAGSRTGLVCTACIRREAARIQAAVR